LLFESNGVCFSFFMVATILGIDLMEILCYVRLVMEGVRAWQYMSRFLADEKLCS
jgi:hypothetical protein